MPSVHELIAMLAILTPIVLGVLIVWGRLGYLQRNALQNVPLRRVDLGPGDVLAAIGLMLLGTLLASPVMKLLGVPVGENAEHLTAEQTAIRALVGQMLTQLPIAIFVVIRATSQPGGGRELGLVPRRLGRDVHMGVAGLLGSVPLVMWVITVVTAASLVFTGPPPKVGHELLRAMRETHSAWALTTLIISATVLAPLFEEIMFRGLLQTALLPIGGRDNRWAVIAIAAACFAVVHLGGVTWQYLPGLFVLGLVLGWLYERTGSLWPGIVMHAGFNAVNTAWLLLS